MYLLTTNDKTIKLWKIAEKDLKKQVKQPSSNKIQLPKMQVIESGVNIFFDK